jgi:hypothetical protein
MIAKVRTIPAGRDSKFTTPVAISLQATRPPYNHFDGQRPTLQKKR